MTSPSDPADEHEAWRATELERMRVKHDVRGLINEPLCVSCLKRISVCGCERGVAVAST